MKIRVEKDNPGRGKVMSKNRGAWSTFTIAKTWKQPKCPSTGEWIKKM